MRQAQPTWYSMDTNFVISILSMKPYASPSKCQNVKVSKRFGHKSEEHYSITIVHITITLMKTRSTKTDQFQFARLCTTYFCFLNFYLILCGLRVSHSDPTYFPVPSRLTSDLPTSPKQAKFKRKT